jgi:carboxymethylenebutenolidase
MRDEGIRYDPELAYSLYGLVFDLFHRKLAEGDLTTTAPTSTETRH